MFQKILNFISPQSLNDLAQVQAESEITKRQKKLEQMIQIINMNEYFQYPEKLIEDGKILMNEFSNDNIDIYIQDESILKISGFVNILIKQKSFQIVMDFSFFLNYPQQVFSICIENKSLEDKDIKLSSYYQSSLGGKWISLNHYLTESKLWLNHQNFQRVFSEAKQLLVNHFPYHKQKKQQQYFSHDQLEQKQQNSIPSNKQIENNVEIEKKEKEIVNKNIIISPIPLNAQDILGPSGLQLKEENQIQMQATKFAIQVMREHRNDIVTLKQQHQDLKLYKQQQDGILIQLIWLRQKLDLDIEFAAGQYNLLQQQINLNDKIQQKNSEEIIEFDDLSYQIIDLAAKDKALTDCYQFISKKFNKQIIDYQKLFQATKEIAGQQFELKLLMNKIYFNQQQ
ncbi:unnamed protein product [Paramecium sonneborni]|uniref:SB domain-containing protein n=1 Tax=Paramecium sonneborni TaxID=65129 RepID=A0A8S1L8U4_9CILI|nr:unnamed protein product [Paramecium sonneborni]